METAIKKLPGVTDASVSFMTQKMTISHTHSSDSSRAYRIFTRVLSPKILNSSASS